MCLQEAATEDFLDEKLIIFYLLQLIVSISYASWIKDHAMCHTSLTTTHAYVMLYYCWLFPKTVKSLSIILIFLIVNMKSQNPTMHLNE